MISIRYAALCLLMSAWGASQAHAGLTWKSQTTELHAQVDSKELTAHFPFTNTGTAPVDIVKITTSCGCTAASSQQMHIEPGQSGEVTAVYQVANHAGQQKKTVAVKTSDQVAPRSSRWSSKSRSYCKSSRSL